jgi:hypothetical protein
MAGRPTSCSAKIENPNHEQYNRFVKYINHSLHSLPLKRPLAAINHIGTAKDHQQVHTTNRWDAKNAIKHATCPWAKNPFHGCRSFWLHNGLFYHRIKPRSHSKSCHLPQSKSIKMQIILTDCFQKISLQCTWGPGLKQEFAFMNLFTRRLIETCRTTSADNNPSAP